MPESVTLTLTVLELHQLRSALRDDVEKDRSFQRRAPILDKAATLAYLKVQAALVASGDVKGVDLNLPPWAARFVLETMAPQPKPKAAAAPKKRARRRPRTSPRQQAAANAAQRAIQTSRRKLDPDVDLDAEPAAAEADL